MSEEKKPEDTKPEDKKPGDKPDDKNPGTYITPHDAFADHKNYHCHRAVLRQRLRAANRSPAR